MKIALICLLALVFTITNALDKKQIPPAECATISSDLQACIDALAAMNADAFCDCKDALIDYYNTCTNGVGVDGVNQAFGNLCGDDGTTAGTSAGTTAGTTSGNDGDGDNSAATIGVTLFTIASAVLVAVGN